MPDNKIQKISVNNLPRLSDVNLAGKSPRPTNMQMAWSDKYDQGLSENLNQKWNRADNQSGLGQLWNGFVSRGISIIPKTLGGFATVAGAIESVFDTTKGIEYAWENDTVKSMDEWDNSLREAFPVYNSFKYDKSGLLGKMLTTSMWANDFLDGAAYVASGFIPGGAVKLIGTGGKLLMASTKVGKALEASKALGIGTTIGISMAYNTVSEASMEAFETQKSIEAIKLERYLAEGKPVDEAKMLAKADAAEAAKTVFAVNALALAIPNYIQSKFFHSDFSTVTKALKRSIIAGESKLALPSVLGKAGEGFISEGLEENIQTAVQQYERSIADNKKDRGPLMESLAFAMAQGIYDFGKGAIGYSQNEEESERALSIALGGILGGGMGSVSAMRERSALTKLSKAVSDDLKTLTTDIIPTAVNLFRENMTVAYEKDGTKKVKLGNEEVDVSNLKLDSAGLPILDTQTVQTLVNRSIANQNLWNEAFTAAFQGNEKMDTFNKELSLASFAFGLASGSKSLLFDKEEKAQILEQYKKGAKGELEALGLTENFDINMAKISSYLGEIENLAKKYASTIESPEENSFKSHMLKTELYLLAKERALSQMQSLPSVNAKDKEVIDAMQKDIKLMRDKLSNGQSELKAAYKKGSLDLKTKVLTYKTLKEKKNKTKEEEDEIAKLAYEIDEHVFAYGTYALKDAGVSSNPIGLNSSHLTSKDFSAGFINNFNELRGRDFVAVTSIEAMFNSTSTTPKDMLLSELYKAYTQTTIVSRNLAEKIKDDLDSIADEEIKEAKVQIDANNDEIQKINSLLSAINFHGEYGVDSSAKAAELNSILGTNINVEDAAAFVREAKVYGDAINDISAQQQEIILNAEKIKVATEEKTRENIENRAIGQRLIDGQAMGRVEEVENILAYEYYETLVGRNADNLIFYFKDLTYKEREQFEEEAITKQIQGLLNKVVSGASDSDVIRRATNWLGYINDVIWPQLVENSQNKGLIQRNINETITSPLYKFIENNATLFEEVIPNIRPILAKANVSGLVAFDALLAIVDQFKQKASKAQLTKLKAQVAEHEKAIYSRAFEASPNKATPNVIAELHQSLVTERSFRYNALDMLFSLVTNLAGVPIGMNDTALIDEGKWEGVAMFKLDLDVYALERHTNNNSNLSSTEKAQILLAIATFHESQWINRIESLLNLSVPFTKVLEAKEKATSKLPFSISLTQNIVLTDTILYVLNPQSRTAVSTSETENAFKLFGIAGAGKSLVVGKLLGDIISELKGVQKENAVYAFAASEEASENINEGVYGTNLKRTIESFLALSEKETKALSLIIVDEALVLTNEAIFAINTKARDNGVKIIFMGDPSQRITYDRSSVLGHTLLSPLNKLTSTTVPLTTTYRTSIDSISSFTSQYRSRLTLRHPALVVASEDYSTVTDTTTLNGVVSTSEDELLQMLRLPTKRKRALIVKDTAAVAKYKALVPSTVEVMTISQIQGAQRDEVFTLLAPELLADTGVDQNRELYTAFSRAKSLLVVGGIPSIKNGTANNSTSLSLDQSEEVKKFNAEATTNNKKATEDVLSSFAIYTPTPSAITPTPIIVVESEKTDTLTAIVHDTSDDEAVQNVSELPSDSETVQIFTEDTVTDIKDKKADIERRRQEELKRFGGRRANDVVIINPDGKNIELTEKEIEEVEYLINTAKEKGLSVDRTQKLLQKNGFTYSISNSPTAFREFLKARLSGEIDTKINGKFLDKINAKYDAELAALENKPINKTDSFELGHPSNYFLTDIFDVETGEKSASLKVGANIEVMRMEKAGKTMLVAITKDHNYEDEQGRYVVVGVLSQENVDKLLSLNPSLLTGNTISFKAEYSGLKFFDLTPRQIKAAKTTEFTLESYGAMQSKFTEEPVLAPTFGEDLIDDLLIKFYESYYKGLIPHSEQIWVKIDEAGNKFLDWSVLNTPSQNSTSVELRIITNEYLSKIENEIPRNFKLHPGLPYIIIRNVKQAGAQENTTTKAIFIPLQPRNLKVDDALVIPIREFYAAASVVEGMTGLKLGTKEFHEYVDNYVVATTKVENGELVSTPLTTPLSEDLNEEQNAELVAALDELIRLHYSVKKQSKHFDSLQKANEFISTRVTKQLAANGSTQFLFATGAEDIELETEEVGGVERVYIEESTLRNGKKRYYIKYKIPASDEVGNVYEMNITAGQGVAQKSFNTIAKANFRNGDKVLRRPQQTEKRTISVGNSLMGTTSSDNSSSFIYWNEFWRSPEVQEVFEELKTKLNVPSINVVEETAQMSMTSVLNWFVDKGIDRARMFSIMQKYTASPMTLPDLKSLVDNIEELRYPIQLPGFNKQGTLSTNLTETSEYTLSDPKGRVQAASMLRFNFDRIVQSSVILSTGEVVVLETEEERQEKEKAEKERKRREELRLAHLYTLTGLLESIAASPLLNDNLKPLVSFLQNTASALSYPVNIQRVKQGYTTPNGVVITKKGQFVTQINKTTGEVTIYLTYDIDELLNDPMGIEVLLHEVNHAYTIPAINKGKADKSAGRQSKERVFFERINVLLKRYKEGLPKARNKRVDEIGRLVESTRRSLEEHLVMLNENLRLESSKSEEEMDLDRVATLSKEIRETTELLNTPEKLREQVAEKWKDETTITLEDTFHDTVSALDEKEFVANLSNAKFRKVAALIDLATPSKKIGGIIREMISAIADYISSLFTGKETNVLTGLEFALEELYRFKKEEKIETATAIKRVNESLDATPQTVEQQVTEDNATFVEATRELTVDRTSQIVEVDNTKLSKELIKQAEKVIAANFKDAAKLEYLEDLFGKDAILVTYNDLGDAKKWSWAPEMKIMFNSDTQSTIDLLKSALDRYNGSSFAYYSPAAPIVQVSSASVFVSTSLNKYVAESFDYPIESKENNIATSIIQSQLLSPLSNDVESLFTEYVDLISSSAPSTAILNLIYNRILDKEDRERVRRDLKVKTNVEAVIALSEVVSSLPQLEEQLAALSTLSKEELNNSEEAQDLNKRIDAFNLVAVTVNVLDKLSSREGKLMTKDILQTNIDRAPHVYSLAKKFVLEQIRENAAKFVGEKNATITDPADPRYFEDADIVLSDLELQQAIREKAKSLADPNHVTIISLKNKLTTTLAELEEVRKTAFSPTVKNKQLYVLEERANTLNELLMMYDSLNRANPLTGELVLTTVMKDLFSTRITNTEEELEKYINTIDSEVTPEEFEYELMTAANINEHIRLYNKNPELTLSGNIKAFLNSIMIQTGVYVPTSVSYYKMMFIALDLEWSKGLENIRKQLENRVAQNRVGLSQVDVAVHTKFIELINIALETDSQGSEDFRTQDLDVPFSDLNVDIVVGRLAGGEKVYHFVTKVGMTAEELAETRNASLEEYEVLVNTPKYNKKLIISRAITAISDKNALSIRNYTDLLLSKNTATRTLLARKLSNRELNFLVRRANARDALKDIMQGMGSMRQGELYIALFNSIGGYNMKFIASKSSGITYSYLQELTNTVEEAAVAGSLMTKARNIKAMKGYATISSATKGEKAKFIIDFFGSFFGLPAITFTANRDVAVITDTIEKIKAFADNIILNDPQTKVGKSAVLTGEEEEANAGEITTPYDEWVADINGYLVHFAGILASDSNYQRNPSVRTLSGDRYYTIHESSHLFDVATQIVANQKVNFPTHFNDPYFDMNIFVGGLSNHKIREVGEFEGTKNEVTSSTTPNLRQNKNKFYEARVIGGFLEGLRSSSGRTHYHFLLPFDKPKGIVFKVNTLNEKDTLQAIRQAIYQVDYQVNVLGESFDAHSFLGFELIKDAFVRLKKNSNNSNITFSGEGFVEALTTEILTLIDEEAKVVANTLISDDVKLKFDTRFHALMASQEIQNLLPSQFTSEDQIKRYNELQHKNFRSYNNDEYNVELETILPLVTLYTRNYVLNSFFVNQLILGKMDNYKKAENIVKRYSSVAGPRIKPLIDSNIGSAETYTALVMQDTVLKKEDLVATLIALNPKMSEQDKVKLNNFFESDQYEITDGQGIMTNSRKANLARGYGSSWRLGSVSKPLHYGVSSTGAPVLVKYSSVSPSVSALDTPLKDVLDELDIPYDDNVENLNKSLLAIVLAKLEMLGVGEGLFESAVKLNPIDYAKAKKLTFSDVVTTDIKELMAMKERGELPTLTLKNSDYGFQFIASDDARKSISVPTQLMYFINLYEDTDIEADRIYEILSDLINNGIQDFKKTISTPRKLRTYLASKLSGQGNEMALKLLLAGVPISHPGIESKVITAIASGFEKATIKQRFKGGKLVLQSSEGIHFFGNEEESEDKPYTDLSYKRELIMVNGKQQDVMVAEAVVPRELLTREQLEALAKGETIFLADALGFRMPSTEIHSAIALRIKGVYDSKDSNVIIVPKEAVPLHGSDFDVDSLFLIMRETFDESNLSYIKSEELKNYTDLVNATAQLLKEQRANALPEIEALQAQLEQLFAQRLQLQAEKESAGIDVTLTKKQTDEILKRFTEYISIPQPTKTGSGSIIRIDIENFDVERAKSEWAAWNGYRYKNGQWTVYSDVFVRLREINETIKEILDVLKPLRQGTDTTFKGVEKLLEEQNVLSKFTLGVSKDDFIGYTKSSEGVYMLDRTLYDTLREDLAKYTEYIATLGDEDLRLKELAEAQIKTIKDLMVKAGKNEILETMLDIITSDNVNIRNRMITPISMVSLDEAIEGLKEVGLDQNREILKLWKPTDAYEIYNSLSSGQILTGAFANATKVFSYLIKASNNQINDYLSAIKALKKEKEETEDRDLKQRLDAEIDSYRKKIVEASGKGARGTLLNEASAFSYNGKLLDKFEMTAGKYLVSEVFDTLINAAIDNVKVQKLPKSFINSRTGNMVVAALFVGIPLADIVKILSHPALRPYVDGSYDKFLSFYSDEKEKMLQNMTQEEFDEVDAGIDMESDIMNNPSGQMSAAMLKALFKMDKVGDDVRYLASFLDLIRNQKVTIRELDAVDVNFQNRVGKIDPQSGIVDIRESFSFVIPALFTASKHIKASYDVHKNILETVNTIFDIHSKEIREQMSGTAPKVQIEGIESAEKDTVIRQSITELVLSKRNKFLIDNTEPVVVKIKGKNYTFSRTKSFLHNVANEFRAIKDFIHRERFSDTTYENSFIDHLNYVKDERGGLSLAFFSDTNLFPEDINMISADFFRLNEFDVKSDGSVTYRNPTSKYELTPFQQRLFAYAQIAYGLNFNTNNFSMFMDMSNHAEVGRELAEEIKKLKTEGIPESYIDLLHLYFGVKNMSKLSSLPFKKMKGDRYTKSGSILYIPKPLKATKKENDNAPVPPPTAPLRIYYNKLVSSPKAVPDKFYKETTKSGSTKLYMRILLPKGLDMVEDYAYTYIGSNYDSYLTVPDENWNVEELFNGTLPTLSTHLMDEKNKTFRSYEKYETLLTTPNQKYLVFERGNFARIGAKVYTITKVEKEDFEYVYTYSEVTDPTPRVTEKLIDKVEIETPSADFQVTEVKGENISSGGSDFAKKLTNPGNSVRVNYKGKSFRNAEHAYQTWKSGTFDEVAYNSTAFKPQGTKAANKATNYQTMVEIITAKLQQHPELITGIAQRGGTAYIQNSTHQVTGDKFWESAGQNKFIEALLQAYNNVAKDDDLSSFAFYDPNIGNNKDNEEQGRKQGITEYISTELAAQVEPITFDEATHAYTKEGQELVSVSTRIAEFSQNKKMDMSEMAAAKAASLFKGIMPGDKRMVRGISKVPITQEEYAAALEKLYTRSAALGEIIHLTIHSYFSKDPLAESKIKTLAKDNAIVSGEYKWLDQKALISLLKTRTSTNFWDDIATDKILTELMVGSTKLGLGGRVDMLIDHGNNVVSIYDFKTGESFGREIERMLLKYGDTAGQLVFDTPRMRAQLQLAIYAFVLRHENPKLTFRELKNIHIRSPNNLDDSPANIVNIVPFLEIIEKQMKDSNPALYADLKKNRPDLFAASSYIVADAASITHATEFQDPALQLEHLINKLQSLILYDKTIAAGFNSTSTKDQNKRSAEIAAITEQIFKLRGQKGINYAAISSDIGWMDEFLGSSSFSTHPYVQFYYKMLSEAKLDARKNYDKWVSQYRVITKALVDASGLPNKSGYVGGIDRNKLFKPLFMETQQGTTTMRRLYHSGDTEFKNLTTAQQNYLNFVNSSMASIFVNTADKVALANRVVTFNQKKGVKRITEVTNLDLYNGVGGKIATRGKQKLGFSYYDGFFPKIPMETYDIQSRFGTFSTEMVEFLRRRYLTYYNEIQFEGWANTTEAIPMKYLDRGTIIEEEYYSLNLEKAVDTFMKHHMFKDKLDNVYAFAQGIKVYLMAKEAMDVNISLKRLVNFFDKSIELHLLGRKQSELTLAARMPYVIASGKIKEFNAIKLLRSLKQFMYAPTMWLKPISGTANFVFASMVNLKEAVKGSFGLEGSYTNFTVGDLAEGYREAWKWQFAAARGQMRDNKLYLLMEKYGYLPDNYDHYVQPNELLTTRNRMFSSRFLTAAHTIPEEIIAASIFYAQMKSIKLEDGTSVWDHYKEVDKTTSYGDKYKAIEWDGAVRGTVVVSSNATQVQTAELTSLSIDEINNMKFLYEKMHGGYRADERTIAEYYIFGELALQLKRFLPSMLKNAFASKGFRATEGEYKEIEVNGQKVKQWTPDVVEGRYRMFAGQALNAIGMLPKKGIGGKQFAEFFEDYGEQGQNYSWDNLSPTQTRDLIDFYVTFLSFGVMLIGGSVMWDADDEDPFKKLYERIMNDFAAITNPIELLNQMTNLLYQPVAPTKWKKLIGAFGTTSWYAMAYALGDEEAVTNMGNIRGYKELQRHIPIVSSLRDVFKFQEEYEQMERLGR